MSEALFSKEDCNVPSFGPAKQRRTQTVKNPSMILGQCKKSSKQEFNWPIANKSSSNQNYTRENLMQSLFVEPKYESTPVKPKKNPKNSETSDCEVLIDNISPIRMNSKSNQRPNDGWDSLKDCNSNMCKIGNNVFGVNNEDRNQMLSLDETFLKSIDLENCEKDLIRRDGFFLLMNHAKKINGNNSSKTTSDNSKANGIMNPPKAVGSVNAFKMKQIVPSMVKPKNKSTSSRSTQNNYSVSSVKHITIDKWLKDSSKKKELNKTINNEKIQCVKDVSDYASVSKRPLPHDDGSPFLKKRLKEYNDVIYGSSKTLDQGIRGNVNEETVQFVEQNHSNAQFNGGDIYGQDLLSKSNGDERKKLLQVEHSVNDGREKTIEKDTSRNWSMNDKFDSMILGNVCKETVTKIHKAESSVSQIFAANPAESSGELGPFFGLPSKVETLFKENKGIGQLYEWQKECLNLEAVKSKKNLVYALPTSGGKTLVAEILLLREMLCHKKNAIFILPYVAIVQEKVQSLYPFAIDLGFFVEEYASGKGRYPPKIRCNKQTVYVATIEKAYTLINFLTEAKRLSEIGLVIVDELHLLGEHGRGATLECLLTRLLFSKESIHIIGMSATIGNLNEIAMFLNAETYINNFRPVELKEYVKCEDTVCAVNYEGEELFTRVRKVGLSYNDEMKKIDPDKICSLVLEVVPEFSCLVFCPTKGSCENVAALFTKIMPRELLEEKKGEKEALFLELLKEGRGKVCPILQKTIPFGVAYHHSGLTGEQRRLLENAFRLGVLCCFCCTTTLAAGVNLPARRVILRCPFVAGEFISQSRYKQMVGRAGRAGLDDVGESILVCQKDDIKRVSALLKSSMENAISKLHVSEGRGLDSLILSSIGLGIATNRTDLHKMMAYTLLHVQMDALEVSAKQLVDVNISKLFKMYALEVDNTVSLVDDSAELNAITVEQGDISFNLSFSTNEIYKSAEQEKKSYLNIGQSTGLKVSRLGRAALEGFIAICRATDLYQDLLHAQASMVLLSHLHLIYLVTPYDMMDEIKIDYEMYYDVYNGLNEKDVHTAQVIGINRGCMINIFKGSRSCCVPRRVMHRFYISLILSDLWNQCDAWEVANKYGISRGAVHTLLSSAASFASCVVRFCKELSEFWALEKLLDGFAQHLSHCSSADLIPLMELPAVKMGRARQLYNAGYQTIVDIAKANPFDLVYSVNNMSRKVAREIIAAAKVLLVEKAENLKEEAKEAEDLVKEFLIQNNE